MNNQFVKLYELTGSFQSWEDMQSKINVEKQVKGINLEPLNVDQLAGTVGPLLEVRYQSQIIFKTRLPFHCAKLRFEQFNKALYEK